MSGSTFCNECPAGMYGNGTGRWACSVCAPGYYDNVTSAHSCEISPAGYIPNDPGTAIVACGDGKYSDTTGMSACKACGGGYYTDAIPAAKCEVPLIYLVTWCAKGWPMLCNLVMLTSWHLTKKLSFGGCSDVLCWIFLGDSNSWGLSYMSYG